MALFHMKTRVCLKYFLNDCIYTMQHKPPATQPGCKMRRVYWNNFKAAGLTSKFSFIKGFKNYLS